MIDDNGDGRGTPADWFRGVRVVKESSDDVAADGLRAHQVHLPLSEQEKALTPDARSQRDKIEQLRAKKADMNEDEYYEQLEVLGLALADIYASADQRH